MNLSEYRASAAEQRRTRDLLKLIPASGHTALDIGARDGYYSLLLADRFEKVIALDLTTPSITHPRIECRAGDAAHLDFEAGSIDFVFCAEVLEHVPQAMLSTACRELERVCRGKLVIGVPYRQDLRVGRTTCASCGGKNPPWGHVNSFDERRLADLFAQCTIEGTSFVGESHDQTNTLACALMDLAGNPYGTYEQEEPCIHCGRSLVPPPPRTLAQKLITKLGFWSRSATAFRAKPRAQWIHVLLARRSGT